MSETWRHISDPYSQTSITASFAYTVNRETPTFGAGGVITGGGNSFTFLQNSSHSHNLTITTTSDVVTDSGYDTYNLDMTGTETYGQGGSVSGGSDSFTWAQTASDNLVLTQDYGGTTLGAYTLYDMTVDDQMYENFSDAGTDILGPSEPGWLRHVHLGLVARPGQHPHRLRRRGHALPHPGLFLRPVGPGSNRLRHSDHRRPHRRDRHLQLQRADQR